MSVEIILLTKSRKYNNYCIAGVDLTSGKWIRLVSSQTDIHCAVPEVDLIYEDGSQTQILDVIRVELTKAVPLHFQPENYEYNSEYYWTKLRSSSLVEVVKLLEQHPDPYVFHNIDKRLLSTFVSGLSPSQHYSLKFIFVARAVLSVERYEKIKYKVSFSYNGVHYNDFSVTDEGFIQKYQSVGRFVLNNVGLVISLGEIFDMDQCHYKLVAAIIQ